MVSDSQVRCLELNSGATNAAASSEEEKIVEESVIQLSYSVDTLYFLVMGALVMLRHVRGGIGSSKKYQ